MAKENEVVVKEEEVKDLSIFEVPEGQEEHLSQEEMELPFLKLAQKSTAQADEDKPEYIKGLKPGMFFNTVTEEVYGPVAKFQQHGYFHNFVIWKGPKGNGTFQGTMSTDEFKEFEKTAVPPLTREGGDMTHTVNGEALRYTDTHSFIVTLPDHMEEGIMIYPLSSTGCKVARKWNTLWRGRRSGVSQTERYATIWELKSEGFTNDAGFAYKQVSSIKPISWATPELAAFGKSQKPFVDAIKSVGVKFTEDHPASSDADESEF